MCHDPFFKFSICRLFFLKYACVICSHVNYCLGFPIDNGFLCKRCKGELWHVMIYMSWLASTYCWVYTIPFTRVIIYHASFSKLFTHPSKLPFIANHRSSFNLVWNSKCIFNIKMQGCVHKNFIKAFITLFLKLET